MISAISYSPLRKSLLHLPRVFFHVLHNTRPLSAAGKRPCLPRMPPCPGPASTTTQPSAHREPFPQRADVMARFRRQRETHAVTSGGPGARLQAPDGGPAAFTGRLQNRRCPCPSGAARVVYDSIEDDADVTGLLGSWVDVNHCEVRSMASWHEISEEARRGNESSTSCVSGTAWQHAWSPVVWRW